VVFGLCDHIRRAMAYHRNLAEMKRKAKQMAQENNKRKEAHVLLLGAKRRIQPGE